MKILVMLAHPDKKSFNHAIANAAVEILKKNGHEVCFHDLYAEKFNPLLLSLEIPKDITLLPEIEKYCTEIAEADGIVIVHPNWWGQPPAILKGWVDRIMRPGVAYEFIEGDSGSGIPRGLLKAETVVVFNTSNTETQREQEAFGDPLESIWRHCIFGLCGVNNLQRKTFNIIVTSSEEQRKAWLEEVKQTIDKYFTAL